MEIIVDTREQAPFSFLGYPDVQIVHGGLWVGDYSLVGLELEVGCERKSLEDLIGCLTKGRERFEKELMRSTYLRSFAVVVEQEASWIQDGFYRSRINPKAAWASILAFSARYKVPFWFCRDRAEAEKTTYDLLRHYLNQRLDAYKKLAMNHTLKSCRRLEEAKENL
ncbi:MAG: hypothetical protein LUI15_06830 [Firmicutes bacterium]|nr:hypothetical protein [Bacillota bacterium]